LDILGFDEYWNYDKQTDKPYMWAEANSYYYRGNLVAKLKGGDIFNVPEIVIPDTEDGIPVSPESNGAPLRPIDIEAMVEANREMIEIIEQTTVKKILEVYDKYKNKLDCFHVAFSGGKDSCVLLDLVKKSLPKGSFVVVFGDTGMEFPDTYEVIEKTRQQCVKEDIPFYTAKSHFEPTESWKLFGPPARVLRWCCSVHKSTPQTLKLREVTGKNDYTGLAYVGVRAHESSPRSEYEYENYGAKQKGQHSYNPILEWTSAEIWLYNYANNNIINDAYKKGSSRIGCICCPSGGSKASYIEKTNYAKETDLFLSLIRDSNARKNIPSSDYISNGGWNARRNGRFLSDNKIVYSETIKNNELEIEVNEPRTEWKEWIKTIGNLTKNKNIFSIVFDNQLFYFKCSETKNGYSIRINEQYLKDFPLFGKLFRYTFRKAAYCMECKTCQAICKHGCLTFKNGLKTENCIHCHECYSMNAGCIAYDSLKIPKGEEKIKTLNCFSNHAPKTEWFDAFFDKLDNFLIANTLGPVQKTKFKRFLKDAGLALKDSATSFAKLGGSLKWNTDTYMGLMLINLVANNPQVEWYITKMDIGRFYRRNEIEDMLTTEGQSQDNISSIISSYKRLTETPLGTVLHFGDVSDEGDLVRTSCSVTDPRVVLYGLFKFAEKCNDYKEFTLATLLNDSIERDGVSPTRIFGLTREDAMPVLLGLSTKYPEFIQVSFTHDLEKITLLSDKTSQDVLGLFKEDMGNG
jgi:phosphoadenosine phosphosulfate reductase